MIRPEAAFVVDPLTVRQKQKGLACANPLKILVANQGFEPRTCGL